MPPNNTDEQPPATTQNDLKDANSESDETPNTLPESFFDSPTEFQPPDGGCAAWLVCATSFCANGTIFCLVNSLGIIGEWLIEQYGTGKALAGAIGSAAFGCLFFFSFLASVITDRIGIRLTAISGGVLCTLGLLSSSLCSDANRVSLLLLTHSFFFGLGASLVYTPSLVVLGHYFHRRLGLVNGICTLGSGVFSVALTRLMKSCLLEPLGLGNTFRVLAGLGALLVPYALAWRPLRPVRHKELDHYLSARSSLAESVHGLRTFLARYFNVSIWRSRGFVIWTLAVPFAMFGYLVPFAFLPNFMRLRAQLQYSLTMAGRNSSHSHGGNGTDPQTQAVLSRAAYDAEVLLISIQVASSAARLVTGPIADLACMNRVRLQQAALCTMGVSIMLLPPLRQFPLAVTLALTFGLGDGAFVCLLGPIAFDLVGPSGASQAIGFLLLAMALPTTTGPPLAGCINEATGRWDIPFYIAGSMPILALLVMFLIPRTVQTFPAASIAEDYDQTSKSYLDVEGSVMGQCFTVGPVRLVRPWLPTGFIETASWKASN